MGFKTPENEDERLNVLRSLKILDTPSNPVFDEIAQRAARAYNAPIATITLVDRDRQWFKARVGLQASETPRDVSFCTHTILRNEPLVLLDTLADPRFSNNPLVVGPPYIRFYAGAPLYYGDQIRLGALCIMDTKPRAAESIDVDLLQNLADQVAGELWVHQAAMAEEADRQITAATK